MPPFASRARVAVALLTLGLATLAPHRLTAQTVRTLTACTPDALGICADLRLTATANFFEIGIRAITATGTPTTPISVYNLIFNTGATAVATPITTNVAPGATGGATISDNSVWEVFDTGDALFLSALTNRGVGGCVAGADVDGFGQAATTCGVGRYITFGFTPSQAFNPNEFSILDFEAVTLSSPSQGASCGGTDVPCTITADVRTAGTPPTTTVPEPSTFVLLGAGLASVVAVSTRRRGV